MHVALVLIFVSKVATHETNTGIRERYTHVFRDNGNGSLSFGIEQANSTSPWIDAPELFLKARCGSSWRSTTTPVQRMETGQAMQATFPLLSVASPGTGIICQFSPTRPYHQPSTMEDTALSELLPQRIASLSLKASVH